MEFKYYDKPWLPAIKGAFFILFGILAMSRIVGSIRNLASLYIVLIGMIGILLLSSGIVVKSSRFRLWTIVSGIINLIFCLILALRIESPREVIGWIILAWIIFMAITELIEAWILFTQKNAFSALFVLNALLTLLFGYFLIVVSGNFTPQSVFYLGVIALFFGLTDELSAYMLSRIKKV
jgi:uncharacterized membrane protein HdeD (DUF308 family)